MRKHSDRIHGVSLRKKILFSLTPLLIFCLFLAGFEAGLRIFAPAAGLSLYEPTTYDGLQWNKINRTCLEKYFPANSALIPELKPSLVPLHRNPESIRILCLGESSMFGTPYETAATIPSILRKQLRHLYPDRDIDVVNMGASAINSNVIRDLAPEMLGLDPDIVVIYTGHNEFYGPDGYGAPWLERQFPWLTRLKYALRGLRTLEWIQPLLRRQPVDTRQTREQNLMRQVSAEAHVALHSGDAKRIFENFRGNLRAIIALFRSRGVRVVVSDISSNLLFPPFSADPVPHLAHLDSLRAHGFAPEALLETQSMISSDSTNAMLHYEAGLSALEIGDSLAAKHSFELARDYDLLKFRAPGRINEIIHEVSGETDVPCVHADSELCAASPHGITGDSLFWEHLHPRAGGYYRIANLFLQTMLREKMLSPPPTGYSILAFDPDSLGIPWLDLAFADLSMQGLTSRWPFDHFHASLAVYPGADTALQRIARAVYGKSTGWSEGCLLTASWFASHHDVVRARTTYQSLLDDYPRAYGTRYLLALLFRDSGRTEEAIAEYRQCIADNSAYPFPRVDLGLLLINRGELDSAETQLRSAISLALTQRMPLTILASAHYGLAAVAANRGRFGAALEELDTALKEYPAYAAARTLRDQLMVHTRHP